MIERKNEGKISMTRSTRLLNIKSQSKIFLAGLGFCTIICSNLREFKQMIIRDYLWDSLDQISDWTT